MPAISQPGSGASNKPQTRWPANALTIEERQKRGQRSLLEGDEAELQAHHALAKARHRPRKDGLAASG